VAENAKNGGGKLSMVWLSLLTENGEVFSSISSINGGYCESWNIALCN
jgi:hypothetical protein